MGELCRSPKLHRQWRIQDLPKGGPWRARACGLGSGGGAPQGGPGAQRGQGAKPLRLKAFLYIFIQKSGQNLRIYMKIWQGVIFRENLRNIVNDTHYFP